MCFDVQQPSATSLKQSVKDRLGPLLTVNSEPSQDSSVASQVCGGNREQGEINVCFLPFTCQILQNVCLTPLFFFLLPLQNPSKVSVKDRLGFSAKPAAPVEKVCGCLCL